MNKIKKVLVTGGLGYIGSHVVVELINNNFEVIIIDNLNNSQINTLDRIKQIVNNNNRIKYYNMDLIDLDSTKNIFNLENPDAIIHLAGYKSVNESIQQPLKYYYNNLTSTLNILKAMEYINCKLLIFSSSATVYGDQLSPYNEKTTIGVGITNTYGQTKFMAETIFQDICKSDKELIIISLRYFNPIGAHSSGLIGEGANSNCNNIMPIILKTALLNLNNSSNKPFTIFGNDYPTKDGTAERDYIHVVDLAIGHLMTLKKYSNLDLIGYHVYNLGNNTPISVKQLVDEFKKINNVDFPVMQGIKRPGDLPSYYADTTKALKELNWKPQKTLQDMVRDSWRYQIKNHKMV